MKVPVHKRAILVYLTALLAVAGCGTNTRNAPAVTELPRIKEAPVFSFTNYDGRPITQDALKGDIYIVSFFFTSCGGPCPVMNSNANVLQAEFADLPDFRIVSFTVDPETDSLPRLAKYAERYAAKPDRWYFLRNSIEAVSELSSKGFMMGDANVPAMHSTRFALVDRSGWIRGYYDGTDKAKVDELREAVRFLEGEKQ